MRLAVSRLVASPWLQKIVEQVSQRELMFQKSHLEKILGRHSSLLHPQRWRDWPATSRELSSRSQCSRLPARSENSLHPRLETSRKRRYRRGLDIPLRLRRARSARRCSRRQASAPRTPSLPQRKPRTHAKFPP